MDHLGRLAGVGLAAIPARDCDYKFTQPQPMPRAGVESRRRPCGASAQTLKQARRHERGSDASVDHTAGVIEPAEEERPIPPRKPPRPPLPPPNPLNSELISMLMPASASLSAD